MNSCYWEVLYRMYFNIQCMECRELRHDSRTVSLLTDHTVFSQNGTLKVWERPVSMVYVMDGGGCGEIHTESGGCEASPKTNRMQKRYVRALYLSQGFGDCEMGDSCSVRVIKNQRLRQTYIEIMKNSFIFCIH
jgi:hypothetical protein